MTKPNTIGTRCPPCAAPGSPIQGGLFDAQVVDQTRREKVRRQIATTHWTVPIGESYKVVAPARDSALPVHRPFELVKTAGAEQVVRHVVFRVHWSFTGASTRAEIAAASHMKSLYSRRPKPPPQRVWWTVTLAGAMPSVLATAGYPRPGSEWAPTIRWCRPGTTRCSFAAPTGHGWRSGSYKRLPDAWHRSRAPDRHRQGRPPGVAPGRWRRRSACALASLQLSWAAPLSSIRPQLALSRNRRPSESATMATPAISSRRLPFPESEKTSRIPGNFLISLALKDLTRPP